MSIKKRTVSQDRKPQLVIKTFPNNPKRVDFILTEPIAPDFFVGYGLVGGGYSVYINNPNWDPLHIGVDKALRLMLYIRKKVLGVTEEIFAKGYELSIEIADSYLACKSEVIKEVKKILENPDLVKTECARDYGNPVVETTKGTAETVPEDSKTTEETTPEGSKSTKN